ncbi:MAG: cyclic nucleotide-binding domain-containing protein, partial [Bacteroidia bacterium]
MQESEIREIIRNLPNLSEVEPEAIDWLLEKSMVSHHAVGEILFQPGDPVDELLIVLEGLVDVFQESPEGRRALFLIEKGNISGNLPFSRAKGASATGKVIEDTTLLRLHKEWFVEMVSVSYAMTQAFVAVMSDRIRSISSKSFQDEKLKALGKISAGLAHELNNPASAMVRSAEVLYQKLSETPDNFKAVMQLRVSP